MNASKDAQPGPSIDLITRTVDYHPPDVEQFRAEIDDLALHGDVGRAGAEAQLTAWHQQWTAGLDIAAAQAFRRCHQEVAACEELRVREESELGRLRREQGIARRHREHIEGVLTGRITADDGGDWKASPRLLEDARRAWLADALLYGGAAVAEAGLNYLTFQLMGGTPVETGVLASAIVLVTVVLPHQIGRLAAERRRAAPGRRLRLAAGIALGSVLWVGSSLFVAAVRTSFLLLPNPVTGDPAFLVEAGLGGHVLTAGWLAVVLAIGMVVFIRSSSRHNPYLAEYRRARAAEAVADQRWNDQRKALRTAQCDGLLAEAGPEHVTRVCDDERRRLAAIADELRGRLHDAPRHWLPAPPVKPIDNAQQPRPLSDT